MSRNRNRNGKAKKSNLVGRVAMVIKEGDKNKGQRVAIKAVNNDIAEVFLLSDVEMKTFCIPLDGLHVYTQERSTEYYTEDIIKTFFGVIKDVFEISKENRAIADVRVGQLSLSHLSPLHKSHLMTLLITSLDISSRHLNCLRVVASSVVITRCRRFTL